MGWRLIGMHVAAVLRDPPRILLPRRVLCSYNGQYKLTAEIRVTVSCDEGRLRVQREGRADTYLYPEVRDVFFEEGRPRTRRIFERDTRGRIVAFVDRREGEDLRWRRSEG